MLLQFGATTVQEKLRAKYSLHIVRLLLENANANGRFTARQQQSFLFKVGTVHHVEYIVQVILLFAQAAVDFAELFDMLLRRDQFHTGWNYLHMRTKLLANLIQVINEYLLWLNWDKK